MYYIHLSGAWVAGNEITLLLKKNGAGVVNIARVLIQQAITAYTSINGATTYYMTAGDNYTVTLGHSRTAGNINTHTDSAWTWLTITKAQES